MKGGSFIEPSKRLQFGDVISGTPETSAASSRPGKVKTKTENGVTYMWDVSESKWVRVTMPKGKSSSTTSAKNQKSQTKSANESPRAKKQNQSQGSEAKGTEGEILEKRENRTGKSGSNARPTGPTDEQMRESVSRGHVYPKKPTAKKPEPLKELESRKAAPIAQKPESTKKQGIQTRPSAPAAPKKPESSEGSGNKRIDRIKRRAEKKVSRIQDRRSKKENVKAAKAGARAMIREAKGKPAKMQQGDFKDTSTNVDFGKPSEMSPKDARKNARAQTKAVNKQYRKNVKAGLEKPVTPAIGNIRKKGGLMDRRKRK